MTIGRNERLCNGMELMETLGYVREAIAEVFVQPLSMPCNDSFLAVDIIYNFVRCAQGLAGFLDRLLLAEEEMSCYQVSKAIKTPTNLQLLAE